MANNEMFECVLVDIRGDECPCPWCSCKECKYLTHMMGASSEAPEVDEEPEDEDEEDESDWLYNHLDDELLFEDDDDGFMTPEDWDLIFGE